MMTPVKFRTLLALLLAVLPMQRTAAYTGLYVFGDTVSTTTNNTSGLPYYHGNRFCNGRVWVEVLAQWQGLSYVAANNKSFYGHDSVALTNPSLPTSVNSFMRPPNVASALFVVWCNDADFVFLAYNYSFPYNNGQDWAAQMTLSIDRHKAAVSTLYDRGARTIIMPKAVNIAAIPDFAGIGLANQQFIKARVAEYNIAFVEALSAHAASKLDLKIYIPDTFSLFEQAQATPAVFGLTNS